MELIEWFTLALLVVTAITAIVTAAYAVLTWRIARANEAVVREMREAQKALNRPYIEVSVSIRSPHYMFLYLSIKNVGKTAAQDVRLSMEPPFQFLGESYPETNIAELSAFSEPFESLPPTAELLFLIGTGWKLPPLEQAKESAPLIFKVKAEYGFSNERVSESTTIDLRPFTGTTVYKEPVIEELERIRKLIETQPNKWSNPS